MTNSRQINKHIGIVACSAEGAALCYRTICSEAKLFLGEHAHPEISIHSHSLADYVRHLDEGNMRGVGQLMMSSATKLAAIGADFLICPDNTIHQALPDIVQDSPLPWLHIADVVAEEAMAQGYQKLGITGTKWLVDSEVYPESLDAKNINYRRPEADQIMEINRIIMDELVYGTFNPKSIAYFQTTIEALKNRQCDAVILGCTEIPLIINNENSSLPTLNSTKLLALAALKKAIYQS